MYKPLIERIKQKISKN